MQRAGARRPPIPQRPGPLLDEVLGFLFASCKFVQREIAKARMRPHGVIVLTQLSMTTFASARVRKPFEAEAFVAELAVEALGDAILPGLAGLDQRGANALRGDPGQERLGNELRTVVAAQEGRCAALAHTKS